MNWKHTPRLLTSLFVAMLLLNTSCSDNKKPEKETPIDGVSTAKNPKGQSFYYVNNPQNVNLAEIIDEGQGVTVILQDGNLFGELKGDKRKYYNQQDQFSYAVKFKGTESFKLRDLNEELLWKVKIYEDKIKLANNEEMTDAYNIRLNDNDKIKVKRNDEEVAALRIVTSDPFTSIEGKYTARNFGSSLALGVLLIEEIPDKEKFLICTEILKMNR